MKFSCLHNWMAVFVSIVIHMLVLSLLYVPVSSKQPFQKIRVVTRVSQTTATTNALNAARIEQTPELPVEKVSPQKKSLQTTRPNQVAPSKSELKETVLKRIAGATQSARLIPSSFQKPEYTDEALDVDLQGDYVARVFVRDNGQVAKVTLPQPIGYGMDERVIRAVSSARFTPATDTYGRKVSRWVEINIEFVLE